MAGTVVFTEIRLGSVKKIKCQWTSDASGNAEDTTAFSYSGQFMGLITVPGAAGDQPSDNYTLKISDSDGVDLLLAGATGNRSNATTEYIKTADMAGVASDKLTFTVSSAGNAKKGTAYLILR